jgi:hypothetical protein
MPGMPRENSGRPPSWGSETRKMSGGTPVTSAPRMADSKLSSASATLPKVTPSALPNFHEGRRGPRATDHPRRRARSHCHRLFESGRTSPADTAERTTSTSSSRGNEGQGRRAWLSSFLVEARRDRRRGYAVTLVAVVSLTATNKGGITGFRRFARKRQEDVS